MAYRYQGMTPSIRQSARTSSRPQTARPLGLWVAAMALTILTPLGAMPASESYQLQLNKPSLYQYWMEQSVVWRSADDNLNFTTGMRWQFKWLPVRLPAPISNDSNNNVRPPADDGSSTPSDSNHYATVEVTILSVEATHTGPASKHRVHVNPALNIREGTDDPLLGAWAALVDVQLFLELDPRTGVVHSVSGQQALLANLRKAHPTLPGQTSSLIADAEAVYSSDRLAALWTRMLELPSVGSGPMELEQPLSGQVLRNWTGSRYQLELEPEATPTLRLAADPTPIELAITALTGEGVVEISNGLLRHSSGTIRLDLSGNALSQALSQQHTMRWELGRIELETRSPQPDRDDGSDDLSADPSTPTLEERIAELSGDYPDQPEPTDGLLLPTE